MRSSLKRWVLPLGAVAVAVLLVVATWMLATRFQSPAQREANAQAPLAQPVVVPVTKGDLKEQLTARAEVTGAAQEKLAIPIPAGAAVITAQGTGAGQQLQAGSVVTWVNDRPLIALPGAFPFYRDMAEGDEGEDVRQLQRALQALGYDISAEGEFGPYTAACVKDMYQQRGSAAVTRPVAEAPAPAPQPGVGNPPSGGEKASTHPEGGQGETTAPQVAAPPAPASTKTEVVVRASELLVLPELPLQVSEAIATGTTLTAENAFFIVGGSDVHLKVQMPAGQAARLKVGMTGSAAVGEQQLAVKIASIKEQEADEQSAEQGPPGSSNTVVELAPLSGAVPAEWAQGDPPLVTIDFFEPLKGALLVPQRAIAVDVAGGTWVLKQVQGAFEQTAIREIRCVAGLCAVEGGIAPGDKVRVDFE
ncbi:peptidoglycan-binding domain-containing protein [Buchananella felis]|uniref:peptidoglycan-binding domain-containing protein n=1 Tax=Buchananella felis TaxID=3231492 RepID=UPI0035298AB9